MLHVEKIKRPQAVQSGGNVIISGVRCLDLAQTLDCGQAFRWTLLSDGRWRGTAYGRLLTVGAAPGILTLYDTTLAEYEEIWRSYFDLDRDYTAILTAVQGDPVLDTALEFADGIRILRQEPWEALCSFIISQNNHVPRIKGIIERLCIRFGRPVDSPVPEDTPEALRSAFPSADDLARRTVDELAPVRAGFRAKYILDAARKIAGGQIVLEQLFCIPLDDARRKLMEINGVGPKVAECALLFGMGRIECFPRDVWIKRAMELLFDGALPEAALPYAGIVQQYIFHYARMTKLKL